MPYYVLHLYGNHEFKNLGDFAKVSEAFAFVETLPDGTYCVRSKYGHEPFSVHVDKENGVLSQSMEYD